MTKSQNKIRLKEIFLGLQDQMYSKLSLNRRILTHPVTKGDASELEWTEMLSTYLPKRYQAEKAFVIDSKGNASEQIDIVIFDRHYSPFLLRENGATYVPAESVYVVIEVKQDLNKQYINYAAIKALSVRKLHRTVSPIVHAGGIVDTPKAPFNILAGILTLNGKLNKNTESELLKLSNNKQLDIGCSLEGETFLIETDGKGKKRLQKFGKDAAFIFFFLKLLSLLKNLGTVPSMNIDEYISGVTNG